MDVMDLAFEEFGHAENPPLIILHGFLASARNWRHIAQKLAAHFHVYVVDMRNHGASPHAPLMDYPSMAIDVLEFLNQRGIKKASLMGHSMGGKIAMWFALNYPDCLDKLIVADIAPVSYSHSFNATLAALQALPLAEISNRKQAEVLLASTIPELSYRQFLLQNLVLIESHYQWRINLDIFYRMAPNIAAFPNCGHLPPCQNKTLFVAGKDSNFVKADAIYPSFPTAQLTFIPDAGHWLHVQEPAVFIEHIENFLRHA
ncbi:MAG: alpha/beta fold hydrolase [Methylococcaceae bacterium]|nr:alpha/beta fold hydrolase [Methylococcaceae bacterium]